MSPVPTVATADAASRHHRLVFSNHNALYLRVEHVGSDFVTVDDLSDLTGAALYTTGTPGLLEIISGTADNDNGLVANISDVDAGTSTFTVDVDFTSDLSDGDIIAVAPPQAIEITTNGGHSLDVTATNDVTKGLKDEYLSHNTPDTVDVGGDVPFYFPIDGEQVVRLLAYALGGYKLDGSTHRIIPFGADDGTYAEAKHGSWYSRDGNGIIEEIFGNTFPDSLTINFPESGPVTASISNQGNFYVREVGGSGKTYPSGSSNYVVDPLPCAAGGRYTRIAAFVEQGGTFGDALTDSQQTAVTDLSITFTREGANARALGNPYMTTTEGVGIDVSLSGTRVLVDNAFHDDEMGGKADPTSQKTEDRLFIRLIDPADSANIVDFDVPRAIIETRSTDRQRGLFRESFSANALQTLDADQCIDTANPLIRVSISNDTDKDILTTLPS